MAGALWPYGVPWTRQVSPRRRWYRHGRPWEIQHLHLDELTDEAGGWRVSWSARRAGDLVYDTLAEAMATVRWVLAQGGLWSESAGGRWVEVDPDDPERTVDGGPAPWRPGQPDPLRGRSGR
ncbi:hypothetical protein [Actinocatenispora rupis]|nr:hypothetical protein [Actinocatenispora rupis]